MKFGLHVSAAGGVVNAPANAHERQCETFQFFTRSPRGGNAPKLTPEVITEFKANCDQFGFKSYYVHAPYYVNFASENERIFKGSMEIVRLELERCSLLGVEAMMVHLGSAKLLKRSDALKKVITGLQQMLKDYKGSTQFLIEISAGAGEVIGDTFDEVALIIEKTQPKIKTEIGVCFDTAHAFASGYDLRTEADVKKTFKLFDEAVGFEKLKLIHGNDSLVEFNTKKDRHWHIGKGKIGAKGFEAIINHPKLKGVNMILETPGEIKDDLANIKTVKKLRK
jgi:deoxyribonuclease-4